MQSHICYFSSFLTKDNKILPSTVAIAINNGATSNNWKAFKCVDKHAKVSGLLDILIYQFFFNGLWLRIV